MPLTDYKGPNVRAEWQLLRSADVEKAVNVFT